MQKQSIETIAQKLKDGGMQCNCDLDNWTPELDTGHSWVCRIHKTAKDIFKTYRFESVPAETLVMPKITDIEQVALRELKLQDTIDDIKNEEVSRKDLWRSAFICGGIAIRDKIKSNFSA